jgi:hypothetical protein
MVGATLHYGASNEDVSTQDDGSIFAAELRTKIHDFSASLGYIVTDEKAGVGNMNLAGENINPLEENHNQVYSIDASTTYLGMAYELDALSFSAMYGITEYGLYTQNEANIAAEYSVNEELSFEVIFVNVDTDDTTIGYNDYSTLSFTVAYSF